MRRLWFSLSLPCKSGHHLTTNAFPLNLCICNTLLVNSNRKSCFKLFSMGYPLPLEYTLTGYINMIMTNVTMSTLHMGLGEIRHHGWLQCVHATYYRLPPRNVYESNVLWRQSAICHLYAYNDHNSLTCSDLQKFRIYLNLTYRIGNWTLGGKVATIKVENL